MVKININECSYFYDKNNFTNECLLDFEYSSFLVWLIIYSKAKNNSKKYKLTKQEKKDINKNVIYTYDFLKVKGLKPFIPLKAMFFIDNSSKLEKIHSFSMSTSIHCNGLKYKTCDCLKNNDNLCYGCFFEEARQRKDIINSIEANFISGYIFRYANNDLLSDYINDNNINLIRYNNHGSFIDNKSIKDLCILANNCKNTKFYGYNEYKKYSLKIVDICKVSNINNLVVNGSNHKAHNTFTVTTNLKLYFDNISKRCLDACITCNKCLNNTGGQNINLLHGFLHKIDKYFYNESNVEWINSFFDNKYNVESFKGKLFLTKIKNMLKKINNDFEKNFNPVISFSNVDNIKNYKDLIFYLESNYL